METREPNSRMDAEKKNFLGMPIDPKIVVLLFLTLIAVLVVAVGAKAVAMLDLGGGGHLIRVPGNYSTIQAAINAAGSGDIIQVQPGVYNESLTINKPVSRRAPLGRRLVASR